MTKKSKIGVTRTKPKKSPDSATDFLFSTENVKVINSYKNRLKNNGVDSWWVVQDPKKLHESVAQCISTIEATQTKRRIQNIQFARAYGNYESIGLPFNNASRYAGQGFTTQANNRVTLNVVQQVVDTAASKIAKDRPKVSFITSGEKDYRLRIQAAQMTKYIGGIFKQAKVYEQSELVFRDAAVTGTGYLQVYEENDQIKTEWIPSLQMIVDELDGHAQKPRSMHRWKLIARDQLMTMFKSEPDKVDKISKCDPYLTGYMAVKATVDMLKVVESWHLPSEPNAKDGLHGITIENCTLLNEEYHDDYFPIIIWRWMDNFMGFFGRSITEEILSLQKEINEQLAVIQQSQRLVARPLILLPTEASIPKDHIGSNDIARIIKYSGGNPPTWVTPTAQNPEVYNHLNWLVQQCFASVGISQASASGMKPSGVDSAVALREVQDIESGRFAMVALRWEQWFVDIARIIVDRSKQLFISNQKLSVSVMEKKILKEIKWKDVDITNQPFDLITFPTSQLPDTPAGRMQTITEMIDNGFISREFGAELLNIDPDLENAVNFQTSSLRRTEQMISKMVDTGEYTRPDSYLNLQQTLSTANGIYNQLCIDDCTEDRLELVRQFITDVIDLQNPPQPQGPAQGPETPPPPPQMMPPGPNGAPMMAPSQPNEPPPMPMQAVNQPLSQ